MRFRLAAAIRAVAEAFPELPIQVGGGIRGDDRMLGFLPPFHSFGLTATVLATGDYVNLAEVTTQNEDDIDSTPGNGVDTDGDGDATDDPGDEDDGDGAVVTPDALVDLELEKSVDNLTPNVGDEITFAVVVNSQDPSTASGVIVTDQLPSGYTYVSNTTSQGGYNSGTGVWTVGDVANLGTATLQLVAGEINQVRMAMGNRELAMMDMQVKASGRAPQVQEEALYDYHLYTVPWTTDLPQNSSKQVSLLDAAGVEIDRVEWGSAPQPGTSIPGKASCIRKA